MYQCAHCGWTGETPVLRAWSGEGCGGVLWTLPVCPECGEEVQPPESRRHPSQAQQS
jgi:predicted RNA-binding Zn-ribbon protein involved in translation (DUF1610 family)